MQVAQLRAPSCGAAMPSVTSRRAAAPRAALLGRAAAAAARGPAAAARAPLAPPRAVRTDADVGAADAATLQLIADVSNAADAAHAAALARAAFDPASAPVYGEDTPLRRKVLTSIADLQAGLLERETEVRLMLLAALCGEHLLLLGPPGTAKSELSRRLAGLTRGRYFERLLTRFSVPEELFGPLSMRGLENDE
jgi:MoxR-like ATPase